MSKALPCRLTLLAISIGQPANAPRSSTPIVGIEPVNRMSRLEHAFEGRIDWGVRTAMAAAHFARIQDVSTHPDARRKLLTGRIRRAPSTKRRRALRLPITGSLLCVPFISRQTELPCSPHGRDDPPTP
jgi:hypothetical protein